MKKTEEQATGFGVKKYNVKLTLTSPMLGSLPKNKEVASKYIAQKAVDEGVITPADAKMEEETFQDMQEKGWTGFALGPNKELVVRDYAIRGFLKAAALALKEDTGLKAPASKIDKHVFVFPRCIPLQRNGKKIMKEDNVLERPLRANTMQGPRVALAKSDMVNEGATLDFEIEVVAGKEFPLAMLKTILNYGKYCGLGQWRNGSYGRFTYEITEA